MSHFENTTNNTSEQNGTQEKTGAKIESYNDALNIMVGWAQSYEKLGAEGPAKEIRQILDGILSSDNKDTKALDKAIQYIDRLIEQKNDLKGRGIATVGFTYDKDKENWNKTGIKDSENDIAIRDLLYQEKYRRSGITQEIKTERKNNQEEANNKESAPTKERSLGDYVDASQKRIEQIYRMLGIELKQENNDTKNEEKTEKEPGDTKKENSHEKYDIPTESKYMYKYFKDNFETKLIGDGTLADFNKAWTKEASEHFKEYIKQCVLLLSKDVPQGRTYIDNLHALDPASIPIFQRLISLKQNDGHAAKWRDVEGTSTSKFLKEYFDIDVEEIDKDYFQHFSRRP
jgi:hypothetical protein